MQTYAPVRQRPETVSAAKLFELIKPELDLVEDEFERQCSSNIQVVDYLGDYLRMSGGKRVRPALLILANCTVGGDGSRSSVIRLATVMEMLHTATLVHDDIIDNSEMRRSRATVNARFGNQAAVLMGDWLYMSAFETAVGERSLDIVDTLTRLTRKMTEGELMQLTQIGRLDVSEREYFDILRRKTAYLFSGCCEVGALLSDAEPAHRDAMRDYGMDLGIAFQLSDDVLDLTGASESLGKTAGSDLLEGKLTLPLIRLLEKQPEMISDLKHVVTEREYSFIAREDLARILSDSGILDDIRSLAGQHIERARKSLDVLPQSEYRSCLEDVLTFVVDRDS